MGVNTNLTKQHYKTNIIKTYVRYIERFYPHIDSRALCEEAGLPYDYVVAHDNWVSVEYENRLMHLCLEKTGNPDLCTEVGKFGTQREMVGELIYFLVSRVVPLSSFYGAFYKMVPLLNRTMKVDVLEQAPGYVAFKYVPQYEGLSGHEKELLLDSLPNVMNNTVGYLSSSSTLRGLQPADVTYHTIHAGERIDHFVVKVRYPMERHGSRLLKVAAVLGTAAMAGAVAWGLTGSTMMTVLAALGALVLPSFCMLAANYRHLQQMSKGLQKTIDRMDRQYLHLQQSRETIKQNLKESQLLNEIIQEFIANRGEKTLLERSGDIISKYMKFDRIMILVADDASSTLRCCKAVGFEGTLGTALDDFTLPIDIHSDDPNKISNVYRLRRPLLISDVPSHLSSLEDSESKRLLEASKSLSFAAVPVATSQNCFGVIIADFHDSQLMVTERDCKTLQNISHQLAVTMEKDRFTESYSKFVPWETLRLLNYRDILDVKLGDYNLQVLTVLFSDIREFTTVMESMDATDAVRFINSYWGTMAPIINRHRGIIDSYMGDCVMGLFKDPQDALDCAIAMQRQLYEYNISHRIGRHFTVKASFGLHRGPVVVAPLGHSGSLSISVISDAVNTASRIDGLNKTLQSNILISSEVAKSVRHPPEVSTRNLGDFRLRGKKDRIGIYEVCDYHYYDLPEHWDEEDPQVQEFHQTIRAGLDRKKNTDDHLHLVVEAFNAGDFSRTRDLIKEAIVHDGVDDPAYEYILNQCKQLQKAG